MPDEFEDYFKEKARNSKLGIDKTELNGKMNQFDGCIDAQLFHDVDPVRFDGTDTDTQHVGDAPGWMSLGNKLKNLSFPVGQQFVTLGRRGGFARGPVSIHQYFGYGRA